MTVDYELHLDGAAAPLPLSADEALDVWPAMRQGRVYCWRAADGTATLINFATIGWARLVPNEIQRQRYIRGHP